MADVTVQRTIPADATVLWEMVSDVTRMGEWSPETRRCEWVRGATGPAVDARFKGRNAIDKRKWSTTCTVTECVPGQAFAFEVGVGPAKAARWAFRFEPNEDGTTVTEEFTDRRAGWLKLAGKLVTGVADRASHNEATMETTLANLEQVATGS